jgi:PAS domain-containing protein
MSRSAAEDYLAIAVNATKEDADCLADVLDRLPVAIYITDDQGTITHFNRACIKLAGRVPVIRHDKWCVTWKLYTLDGAPLPHDQCPMAVAIREARSIRGVEAVAERPDGTRLNFVPYPTPLFDDAGTLIGAVNLLVDVTQERHADHLRRQALRCRRLAAFVDDERTCTTLTAMADEYETSAAHLLAPN